MKYPSNEKRRENEQKSEICVSGSLKRWIT